MKTIIFVTVGFPGSGKTYFSRKLADRYNLFHLNSDKIRSELSPNNTWEADNKITFQVMDYIAEECLKRGISLVYDANSTKRIFRKKQQDLAKKYDANYLTLVFDTPVDVALTRIKERALITSKTLKKYHREVSPEILFNIKDSNESPAEDEPFLVIKGDQAVSDGLEKVEKYLNSVILSD